MSEPQLQPAQDYVELFVNGTLMRDLELNDNLTSVGARFLGEFRTTAVYRLWSINDVHPAMIRVTDHSGTAVDGELWAVPNAAMAGILSKEPPGLSIGKVTLDNGHTVLGVLGEPALVEGQREITSYGSWRAYTAHNAAGEDSR